MPGPGHGGGRHGGMGPRGGGHGGFGGPPPAPHHHRPMGWRRRGCLGCCIPFLMGLFGIVGLIIVLLISAIF